jgi:hypothetical protein
VLARWRSRLIPTAALAAALLVGAPGAGATTETMRVNARVVLGFTNENMVDVEATGLVEGRPPRRYGAAHQVQRR